jgi:hypothetical protein
MMSVLEQFDKVAAAGILARTALSLAYAAVPVSNSVAGEDRVRANVIEEARNHLGLQPDDFEEGTIEKIADFLDAESDKLIAPPDVASALKRLAERGDLPSDLYEIQVVENVKDLYGKGYSLEKKLIETTVRAPTVEQHFGPAINLNEPIMVSLFAKSFRTRWSPKDFVMLVAGQRDGTTLNVMQAWRIYTSRVDVSGIKAPIDWLKRFAETYGAEIEVNGKRAKFFYSEEISSRPEIKAEVGGKGNPREIIVADFAKWHGEKLTASLIVAIDSYKYRSTLKALGVRENDILEKLV